MPSTVVDQVHRLARRAKAKQQLTFTNLLNEDLDELYANIPGIDDPDTDDAGAAGVDDSDDDDSSDYNPNDEMSDEGNSDEDEDESDADEDDDNDHNDVAPQIPGMDEEDDTEDVETPGVDDENNAETPGVDDESEDAENTGVDNEFAEAENDIPQDDGQQSGEEQHDDPDTTRTYGGMRLRSQHRKEYDVFEDENDPIVLLQFSEDLEHLEEMDSLLKLNTLS